MPDTPTPTHPLGALTARLHPEGGPILTLALNGTHAEIHGPTFHVDGTPTGRFTPIQTRTERGEGMDRLRLTCRSVDDDRLTLHVVLQAATHSPFARLRYSLTAEGATLTRPDGRDHLTYLHVGVPIPPDADLHEVQLGHFDPLRHAYLPVLRRLPYHEATLEGPLEGPLLLLACGKGHVLVAYEHGADHGRGFLEYALDQGGVVLRARRGNHHHGQALAPPGWTSPWIQVGLLGGDADQALSRYRAFLLDELGAPGASRAPRVYYNTWNAQERGAYYQGRAYTDGLTLDRVLRDVDVAHRLGVDTFVLDVGWYTRAGDWLAHPERFPDGLHEVRRRLDRHGMHLGLWFDPMAAALDSDAFTRSPHLEATLGGKPAWRDWPWGTEPACHMCLVSDYADHFVERVAHLHRTLGVTYLKWDGVDQEGCDSPLHRHGDARHTPEERAERYAFEIGPALVRMAEAIHARCEGMVIDLDVTERRRAFGLGFLSVGRYFLVNNGPYYTDLDTPASVRIEPNTGNALFYPGAARSRVCRAGVEFDKVLPAHLLLAHFYPEGDARVQRNAAASLALGGHGLWGDLGALSDEEIERLGAMIRAYKRVAPHAARAGGHRVGFIGASPEVVEKLDPSSMSGVIALFSASGGKVTHVTRPLDPHRDVTVDGADEWSRLGDGRLRVHADLDAHDARLVLVSPVEPDLSARSTRGE
ncbi:alpha-galactosidase [Deinococcus pimensis]|uniref:alpha-galactosidase n=1 Tax=Deinococcus pimensis TaxID=309888 RepID=UPI000485F649|nr:alpha-galactosidase [Deinococcus pimensis]